MCRFLSCLCALVVLAGCATERRVVGTDTKTAKDPLLKKYASNFKYEKGEDGMIKASSDQRSEFESMMFDDAKGKDLSKKGFNTETFKSKMWGGKKDFATREFSGQDKSVKTPYFVTKQAKEGQTLFSDGDKEFAKKASDVSKDNWFAASRKVDVHNNSRIGNTPDVEPKIMDYRGEYARKTIEETNNILGRSNKD